MLYEPILLIRLVADILKRAHVNQTHQLRRRCPYKYVRQATLRILPNTYICMCAEIDNQFQYVSIQYRIDFCFDYHLPIIDSLGFVRSFKNWF